MLALAGAGVPIGFLGIEAEFLGALGATTMGACVGITVVPVVLPLGYTFSVPLNGGGGGS